MRRYTRNHQSRILILAFALVVAAAGAALIGAGVASAQSVPGQENTTTTPTPGERINQNVVLLESSYNADTGEGTFRFRVSRPVSLTLTDAGEFWEGGEMDNQQTFVFEEGTHTVTVPLTEVEGAVGATITTGEVRYAEIIRDFEISRAPVDYQLVQLLIAGTLLGTAGVTLRVVRSRYDDEDDWSERRL